MSPASISTQSQWGRPFHARAAVTGVLQRTQQVVGDGADVTVRPAGGDDHGVGHRTLVLEVDEYDVLGLVVFKPGQDQFAQTAFDGRTERVSGGGLDRDGRDLPVRWARCRDSAWCSLCGRISQRQTYHGLVVGGQAEIPIAPRLFRARISVDDAKLSGAAR